MLRCQTQQKNTDSQRGFSAPESTFPHNGLWNPNNRRPEFPITFIHLSPGLILLVFFGLATRSFGSDMASSISEEGTALVPLWLLRDGEKKRRLLYKPKYDTVCFFLFVFQVIIFQCISRLPTSSLGLSWLFRRPPLVPEGAALGVLTHLNGAAQTSSSPLSAS